MVMSAFDSEVIDHVADVISRPLRWLVQYMTIQRLAWWERVNRKEGLKVKEERVKEEEKSCT